MRISRDSTLSTAPSVCAALVTSRVRGVTRRSKWAKGWRVPAYTRFAPLLKASSTSACPIPRFPPVTTTCLFVRLIVSAPVSRCNQDDRGAEKESINAAAAAWRLHFGGIVSNLVSLGYTVGALVPFVAMGLLGLVRVGTNAWCAG